MDNFLIILVLYKKNEKDSNTLSSIISNMYNYNKFHMVIWDNSPTRMLSYGKLEQINKIINTQYIHCPENYPISKVYNIVIKQNINLYQYVILLDHDTEISTLFFKEIENNVSKTSNTCKLLLPKVYSNNTLVSPAKLYGFYGKNISYILEGYKLSKYKTAINSGMIISMDIFRDGFEYDINLTLYGIDDYFMKLYAKKFPYFYVLNCNLSHSLDFFNGNESIEKRYFRFKNMMSAIIYLNKNNIFQMTFAYIYTFLHRCRFYIKYKY